MHVLLFGPESALSQPLALAFAEADHFVHHVDRIDDIPAFADFYALDALLLDPSHERGVAFSWLRKQRALGNTVPALALAAEPISSVEAILWLDTADDVIRLPIDGREVVARILAVARRRLDQSTAEITVDSVTINPRTKTLTVAGAPVHVTGKEFQMIETLMLRPIAVISKEMFLSALYGGMDEPELKIIDVFICKLRQKLTRAGAPADFITTVWGRGYSLAPSLRSASAARHDAFLESAKTGAVGAAD